VGGYRASPRKGVEKGVNSQKKNNEQKKRRYSEGNGGGGVSERQTSLGRRGSPGGLKKWWKKGENY